jgi:hypothetical protein
MITKAHAMDEIAIVQSGFQVTKVEEIFGTVTPS